MILKCLEQYTRIGPLRLERYWSSHGLAARVLGRQSSGSTCRVDLESRLLLIAGGSGDRSFTSQFSFAGNSLAARFLLKTKTIGVVRKLASEVFLTSPAVVPFPEHSADSTFLFLSLFAMPELYDSASLSTTTLVGLKLSNTGHTGPNQAL